VSALEDTLLWQLRAAGAPLPTPQYRFCARRWRFDGAYPPRKLAYEVDGATWTGGRHTRGAGYEADCEKLNTAVLLGWRVLRFTRAMIEDGRALATLTQLLQETDG
jgi:hypothetical protein